MELDYLAIEYIEPIPPSSHQRVDNYRATEAYYMRWLKRDLEAVAQLNPEGDGIIYFRRTDGTMYLGFIPISKTDIEKKRVQAPCFKHEDHWFKPQT